jgi:hypothetical protein
MSTNGAWVDGVFYDGIALTAADLNANNQWILGQAGSSILLNLANTWLAPQTYSGGLIITPTTVAGLPASPVDGQMGYVTDATSRTFAAAPTGGGSDHVPVWYDGSEWRIG